MLLEWLMDTAACGQSSVSDAAGLPLHSAAVSPQQGCMHLAATVHVNQSQKVSVRSLTAAALHAAVLMAVGRGAAEGFGLVAQLVLAGRKCLSIGVAANETLEV
jgi:hypothetical protein